VRLVSVLASAALLWSCASPPEARRYELQGQILAIRPERQEVVIKHGDIKNFMPGMTMPFKVSDAALLTGRAPGDLVTATLVVGEVEAHLETLVKTGSAPLDEKAPPEPPKVAATGERLADAPLVDQQAKATSLASFRGHRLALTFVYTRCPIPDFCPLMDRHFAAVQKMLAGDPALADVRLVSVTLDPVFDTPTVLRAHAARVGANPSVWSFLTGEPANVAAFSEQFGLYVEHGTSDPADITHNLRTAVIDPEGRLAKVHTGNSWTPAELVADLTALTPPRR
jgi:protein SCO1/2